MTKEKEGDKRKKAAAPLRPVEMVTPSLIPQPEVLRPFRPMLQGPGLNRFTSISGRNAEATVDEITGMATITEGDMTIFIEKFSLVSGLRVSAYKLLDACTILLTAQNHFRTDGPLNTLIELPLDDYMHQCGIPLTKASKDKARRKVREDLDALYNMSLEWSEPAGNQGVRDYARTRLISAQGIKGGKIIMRFSEDMARYLTQSYIMHYPMALFRLDERNPNAYYFGKKLLLHHSMNNNQRRGTATVLSVRALLESTQDIPTPEQVMAEDRHLERRIIVPFENALNALSDILTWEYCNAKAVPLTDEQLERFTFDRFLNCYVHFTVKEAEDT